MYVLDIDQRQQKQISTPYNNVDLTLKRISSFKDNKRKEKEIKEIFSVTSQEIIKKIFTEYLDKETVLLIEYNESTNNYHIYFTYNQYISEFALKSLKDELKNKHNMIFDFYSNKDNKKLRLPFSKAYNKFSNEMDFKKYNLIKPIQAKYFDKINFIFSSTQNILNLSKLELTKFLKKNNNFGKNIQPVITLKNNKSIYYNEQELFYGNGTRSISQPKIAFKTLSEKGNFNKFVEYCNYYNDGTSKDMRYLPENEKNRMLQKIYDWAYKNFDRNKFCKNDIDFLKSSKKIFVDWDSSELPNDEFFYLKSILNSRFNVMFPKFYEKNKQRFISECILVYQFIKSIIIYRQDNYVFNIKEEHLKSLEKGYPIAFKLFENLSKVKNIRNIKKILKFLYSCNIISKIFIEDKVSKRLYNHSYKAIRYCIHYVINDLKELYDSLFNRVFKKSIKLLIVFIINTNKKYNNTVKFHNNQYEDLLNFSPG